jgi:predicted nucleotide-binding protein
LTSRSKTYNSARFPAEVLRDSFRLYSHHLGGRKSGTFPSIQRVVETEHETYDLDSDAEWYVLYERPATIRASLSYRSVHLRSGKDDAKWEYTMTSTHSTLAVLLPNSDQVESVFQPLEDAHKDAIVSQPVIPSASAELSIFIGHGRSQVWLQLQNYLGNLQGLTVAAYETKSRVGSSVKEVLQSLLKEASFAILIHTAEDEQLDGKMRARQNVVHETGLFQGRLGFERAIVLREESCEEFSNHTGINEIRFAAGNIRVPRVSRR